MLDEINLRPSSGRANPGQTAAGAAMSTAKAMLSGGKFFCNRVKKEVTSEECVSVYLDARQNNKQHIPCSECAKVIIMLKNKQTKQIDVSPFSGWTKFNPSERARATEEFVSFSSTTMSFSSAATESLGILRYKTVDVYLTPGKIGLEFSDDASGALKISKDPKSKHVAKISATGFLKHTGLDFKNTKSRRFRIEKVGEMACCIHLDKEMVYATK